MFRGSYRFIIFALGITVICQDYIIFPRSACAAIENYQAPSPVDTFGKRETISLERAITLAIHYNYQLNISRDEISSTQKSINAAYTDALPQFTAIALPGIDLVRPSEFTFAFAGLAMQPITQLYRTGVNINIQKLEQQQSKQAVRLRQQQVVNSVKVTYYAILEILDGITSINEQIKYLSELQLVVEEQVVKGAALDVDLLEVRTRLASAQYDLQNLKDSLATNSEQLNHLMGRDPRMPFDLVQVGATITEGEETNLATAEALALKQRPELQEEQMQIQKILKDRKIILSRYVPDVSVGVVSIESHNFNAFPPRNYFAPSFLATWDVYDWNRKVFLAQQDKIKAHQERLRLSDLIDNVIIDVRDKSRKIRLARQRLEVAKMRRNTAKERLRIDMKRLKVGSALLAQVLESQSALADAERQQIDSALAFWVAKSEFDLALGKDIL